MNIGRVIELKSEVYYMQIYQLINSCQGEDCDAVALAIRASRTPPVVPI